MEILKMSDNPYKTLLVNIWNSLQILEDEREETTFSVTEVNGIIDTLKTAQKFAEGIMALETLEFYKIKDMETGKFYSGKSNWTKKGKAYYHKGHASNALRMMGRRKGDFKILKYIQIEHSETVIEQIEYEQGQTTNQ